MTPPPFPGLPGAPAFASCRTGASIRMDVGCPFVVRRHPCCVEKWYYDSHPVPHTSCTPWLVGRVVCGALQRSYRSQGGKDLRTAPRHETPGRPRREGTWGVRQDVTLRPPPAGPQSPSPRTAARRSAASPLVSPARAGMPSLRRSAVCFSEAGCCRQGASASTSRTTPRWRA